MKSKHSPNTAKPPRLRVNLKDVNHAEFATAVQAHLGQQKVSLMLDNAVVAYFKAQAGEIGYQALINQVLHQFMVSNPKLGIPRQE